MRGGRGWNGPRHDHRPVTRDPPSSPGEAGLGPAFAGAAATFSGIGLARFAYVPLFPAMVSAGWVSGGEAGLLGAVNLAGYLAGALAGRGVARRIGTRAALNGGMALATLSCAGCAWNAGILWLALWRGAAGVAGGVLMALAGPAVQGAVLARRRGLAGGVVITGVGAGIIVAALAVPALLGGGGVGLTWLALAALVATVWTFAATSWPATPVPEVVGAPEPAADLYSAYALSAAGLVPHFVFFGDLMVRGRGFDTPEASAAWLAFGLGGLLGPTVGGRVADRLGALPAVRVWLAIQVGALLLAFATSLAPLLLSAFLAGFASIGLTAVILARARELAGPGAGAIWVRATVAFAAAQGTTGFAYAALFARTTSHDTLIATGLALSVAALVPVLRPASGRRSDT